MTQTTTTTVSTQTFLASLNGARHVTRPFDYWLLEDVLPEATCDAIAALPIDPPADAAFDGRRESNNSSRVYFSPANQARFAICHEVAEVFNAPAVKRAITRATGADLAQARLRIEYCQDADGFWLEPHVDIPVKRFTMLIYLADSPELYDAGTDIYDASPEHKLVDTAPCAWNSGLIFIPGKDTWHGFSRRPIHGVRKSIIVNYVGPEWRASEELA